MREFQTGRLRLRQWRASGGKPFAEPNSGVRHDRDQPGLRFGLAGSIPTILQGMDASSSKM